MNKPNTTSTPGKRFFSNTNPPNPTLCNLDAALVARGDSPTPLQARTSWTVVQLDGVKAPRQRSTKTHGKTGHYKPTKHRYFRQLHHHHPIG